VLECVRLLAHFVAMKGLLLSILLVGSGATELTKDTWDAAVAGKSVFVKFLAPW